MCLPARGEDGVYKVALKEHGHVEEEPSTYPVCKKTAPGLPLPLPFFAPAPKQMPFSTLMHIHVSPVF